VHLHAHHLVGLDAERDAVGEVERLVVDLRDHERRALARIQGVDEGRARERLGPSSVLVTR
jgi:hypothetical protein